MNQPLLNTLLWLISLSTTLYGQGIEGSVVDAENNPVEFATIYVKELGTGASTNLEGDFKMSLPSGTYHLVFQHLGYKAKELQVSIDADYLKLNVIIEVEDVLLRTVVISANNEDPAYTIMRKAITKAKYHKQQLNSFETEVYTKGAGRLIDAPFFLRKTLEKEGVDSTTSYTSETVSIIKYTRPNTYDEKVISVRSTGDDYGTNPNSFLLGSFYDPLYVNAISPLSPKAFGYYKFEYLGTKVERGNEISKIKVTPRSRGDNVFWGVISIVEDDWSLQSTNLNVINLGVKTNIKQIYEPIDAKAWLPISHRFEVTGKIYGFKFEYQFLSTMGKYKIELNPDLVQEFEIIDENVEKEIAKELQNKPPNEMEETLAQGGELTRKQFRKLINNYEKEEKKSRKEPLVQSSYTYKIDSLAKKSDSSYWAQIRPIPLTEYEIKGYHKLDSATVAEKAEAEGDTAITNRGSNFSVMDFLTTYTFKLSDKDRLTYYSPLMLFNYNTVEGFNLGIKFKYVHTNKNKTKLFIWPQAKYGFDSERFYGKVHSTFRYGPTYQRSSISLNGGVYTNQLNYEDPISPLVNSITTLIWKGNYLKLYESRYIALSHKGYATPKISYSLGVVGQRRIPLVNTSDYTWSKKPEAFSPNAPDNVEVATTEFVENNALVINAGFTYKPWLTYSIKNGRKRVRNPLSPSFSLHYTSGVDAGNFNGADFNQIEFGYKHSFQPGVRGQFFIDATAGVFLGTKPTVFMDYKHFAGNESPFLMEDPVGSYRLLPYYLYSTSDKYATAQVLYQFRKFLFTQFPLMRLTGVKELAYVSYLVTPNTGNYIEVGYGLDNLFRFLRLEAAASFIDGSYNGFVVKIGIATSITTGDGSVSIGF